MIDGVIVDNSRELVDRLYRLLEIHGEHIAAFFEIMDEIHRTEAWRVEDCASFADFCKRRVMTSIPKSARPLLVVQFRELGWTLRETAAAVGASPATVLRDERAVGAQDAGAVSSETAGDDDAGHGEQLRGDGGPASPLGEDGQPAPASNDDGGQRAESAPAWPPPYAWQMREAADAIDAKLRYLDGWLEKRPGAAEG